MDETTIQISGLSKSYAGKKVIDNISLTVSSGEVYGLLGANGAGKSTTIECILGTRKADAGKIRILGLDPHKDRKPIFEQVGVQFQEANYQDKITLWELCQVTAALYRKPADPAALLDKFGLSGKKRCPVKELSGGQRQRLFIVLALIPNPEVVFLDELTTGLDAKARREVWNILSDLKKQGVTIFLTSHFMDEVEKLCDQICILKKGRAVFHGTVSEAIKNSPCNQLEDAYLWYTEEELEHESI